MLITCLVQVYWANLIHIFLQIFSVFMLIFNMLTLPSGLGLEISGNLVKVGVSLNPLRIIRTNPHKNSRTKKTLLH
jgi:hypothetical protein